MTYRAQTRAIQDALLELGYDLPRFGADGHAGGETFDAVKQWIANGGEPKPTPVGPRKTGMLTRIIWHWSAGGYAFTELAAEHYHFGIDGDGNVHAGDHEPEDNISTSDGDYAAHVRGFNTRAIGVSMMGMAGATADGRGVNPGGYPIKDIQVEAMLEQTAKLCRIYGIPVTRETTLSHAEVAETFGIPQSGKWDIRWLPGWSDVKTAVETGDILRARLKQLV